MPASGAAFTAVKKAADALIPAKALVGDSNSKTDAQTYAAALLAVRLGSSVYRQKALDALDAVQRNTTTWTNADPILGPARNTACFVIAADLVGYRTPGFVSFLVKLRDSGDRGGIAKVQEARPNNFGTHCSAARAAIDVYVGDTADLARCVTVFKGWLGDRAAYSGFKWGSLAWQANAAQPVGINPKGATKLGHSIDGVLPDDQRRGCGFVWPPCKENYVWEALQGATVAAEILTRAGHPAWEWSDRALHRAVTWLYQACQFPAAGDDTWIPWLVNRAYGSTFTTKPASIGKNMGFTDWTHA